MSTNQQTGSVVLGVVLLVAALGTGSWLLGLAGVGVLIAVGWVARSAGRPTAALEPWPWPPDFRALAEGMARRIDPSPKRVLPPDGQGSTFAQVATTGAELTQLVADKPRLWRWALFASVLLQRRNAVQSRLRVCASGYQPRAEVAPLSGQAYSRTAYHAMTTLNDLAMQTNQFMLSPAFMGAFGDFGDEGSADADAISAVANRLMDYHGAFLAQAESCLQTPVTSDALVFVQDVGAFTLCPLVGFEQFVTTMCLRVAEAQDLMPYVEGTVLLDQVALVIALPDGLGERVVAHITRFNA